MDFVLQPTQGERDSSQDEILAKCLIDGGAGLHNYMSPDIAERLREAGSRPLSSSVVTKSPLEGGSSFPCKYRLHVHCTLFDELNLKNSTIELDFHVLELDCKYDIIVGNAATTEHGLLFRMHKQLFGSTAEAAPEQAKVAVLPGPNIPSSKDPAIFLGYVQASQRKNIRIPLGDLIDKAETGEEFPPEYAPEEWDNPWDPHQREGTDHSNIPTDLSGDPETIREVQALLQEYETCFSRELNEIPADVEPIKLEVDERKWQTKKNSGPARTQSQIRKTETLRQVRLMLKQKLIKPSEAVYYSQVILAPKPNGAWRFCVDYRALNTCSERESWPLPNIEAMLHRIGDARPRYFAVMDATKGFFQTPVHLASQIFTAFICFAGIYQW